MLFCLYKRVWQLTDAVALLWVVQVIANLLSWPVMDGFVTAAAFIITSTQLQNLLGLTFEKDNVFFVQVCAASVLHLWHNKVVQLPH